MQYKCSSDVARGPLGPAPRLFCRKNIFLNLRYKYEEWIYILLYFLLLLWLYAFELKSEAGLSQFLVPLCFGSHHSICDDCNCRAHIFSFATRQIISAFHYDREEIVRCGDRGGFMYRQHGQLQRAGNFQGLQRTAKKCYFMQR